MMRALFVAMLATLPPLLASLPLAASEAPKRVIVAGGVITEIAYALGRQDQLVGVDSTSQHPPEALASKPNIGYVRALSAEGVLSLGPDHIVAIEGAGPPGVLDLLREARIPITTIPEDLTEQGVLHRIRAVGAALGATAEAQKLAARVETDFSELARERAAQAGKKRVLFILSMQNGRVLVGGRNSSADAIIRLAGGINAADAVEGYKPLSDEGLLAAAPEVLVMMQRGGHAVSAADVFAHPALGAVPAATDRALVSMDGLLLLGFGPRTPEAARSLMQAIHAPRKKAAKE
jgi:iron complex transport system substrate-binding protein